MNSLNITQFDFDIPQDLIANEPLKNRDHSNVLHFDKKTNAINHTTFKSIANLIPSNSILVFNNTKVIKARIIATRKSGGKIECFFLKNISNNHWVGLIKNSKRIKDGEELIVKDHKIVVKNIKEKTAEFLIKGTLSDLDFLEKHGNVPLPPYIKQENPNNFDKEYQTIFATSPGAVAAPTASLHFTKETFAQLKAKNIDITYITLHVGLGTFNPIISENIYDHIMHKENYIISESSALELNEAKRKKKNIFAVGTTVIRCLESNIQNDEFHPGKYETNLFITPKYKFKCVDGIITNFHLPKSSLFILIASFIGTDKAKEIYELAVKKHYRFFSFGDAMLIT